MGGRRHAQGSPSPLPLTEPTMAEIYIPAPERERLSPASIRGLILLATLFFDAVVVIAYIEIFGG